MYQCGDGPAFVGYVEQYDRDAMAKAERDRTEALKHGPAWSGHTELPNFLLLKRPGDKKWTGMSDPALIAKFTQPVCPDGKSGPIRAVVPGE